MNAFMHGPSFFSFHFFSFSISFPKLTIFPILRYSLYNWIGEHEITKLKKIFASNPEKRTQNKHKKT